MYIKVFLFRIPIKNTTLYNIQVKVNKKAPYFKSAWSYEPFDELDDDRPTQCPPEVGQNDA